MLKTAVSIVKKLQKAGYQAYFAGGSVRDMLMGREPQDYDIATSAKPEEIEVLMEKTYPIGKQFGVILVEENGHHFEIATFRSDSSYSDGRRPDAVLFTNAEEDAKRRDFTINGLFYDPIEKKIHDFVGGQQDLEKGILRFIGDPHERVKEDHLRLLRGIRFKNNFRFEYDPPTQNAFHELANLIDDISKERIQDEMTKMLLHPHRAHSLREMDKFGMLERILPEITACKGIDQPSQYHKEGDVFTHTLLALHSMPENFVGEELVWAVLLHDIGKPKTFADKADRIHFNGHALLSAEMAKRVCRRLKFSNEKTTKIGWLIEHHMTIGFIPEMRRAHQANLFWNIWFEDLMKLHYCDEHGSVPSDLSLYHKVMKLYEDFKSEKLLEDHFKPKLSGDDLMKEFKLKPGPKIKELLQVQREAQIEGLIKDGNDARKFIQGYLSNL
jgi:poly(A) polymerase